MEPFTVDHSLHPSLFSELGYDVFFRPGPGFSNSILCCNIAFKTNKVKVCRRVRSQTRPALPAGTDWVYNVTKIINNETNHTK